MSKCSYFFNTLNNLNHSGDIPELIREIYDKDSEKCDKKYFINIVEKHLSPFEIDKIINYQHIGYLRLYKLHQYKAYITWNIFTRMSIKNKYCEMIDYPIRKLRNWWR